MEDTLVDALNAEVGVHICHINTKVGLAPKTYRLHFFN